MSSTINEKWIEDNQEESVDPRVQVELERLNTATDLINKLEIELDEARSNFRLLLSESSQKINHLLNKLGSCIEKARPYYDSRIRAKELQADAQKAALRYERASSAHTVAKEMVHLAEEGLQKEGRTFDPAWQEMLNHATTRVNEAEIERVLSERQHQETSLAYNEAEQRVHQLHQELKRAIVKSSLSTRRSLLELNNLANQHQLQLLPYFEMKAQFNHMLEEQKKKVNHLEQSVMQVKMSYADALRNLEEISDEIHHKRKMTSTPSPVRGEGVGAESPQLSRPTYINTESLPFSAKTQEMVTSSTLKRPMHPEDIYLRLPNTTNAKAPKLVNTSSATLPARIGTESESTRSQRDANSECADSVKQIIISASALHSKEVSPRPGVSMSSESGTCSAEPVFNGQLSIIPFNTDITSGIRETNKSEEHKHSRGICAAKFAEELDQEAQNAFVQSFHQTKHTASEFSPNTECTFESIDLNVPENDLSNPESPVARKHSGADTGLNMLRIQKDEQSDTDSLASGGTADTLDDHQIECLLLDKFFEQDYQNLANACEDLSVNSEF